jgi:hypothetical protein
MNFIEFAEGEEEVATCQAVILRGFIDVPPESVAGHDLMMEAVVTGHPQPGEIFVTTSEKGRSPISIDELANSPKILIFEVTARTQIGMEVRYAGCFGNKELQFKGPTAPFAIPYSIPKFLRVQFGAKEGWQVEGQVSRAVRAAMATHNRDRGEERGRGASNNWAHPQEARGGGWAQQPQFTQGGSQHPGGRDGSSDKGGGMINRGGGSQPPYNQGGGSQHAQGVGSQHAGGQGYGGYGGEVLFTRSVNNTLHESYEISISRYNLPYANPYAM